MHKINNSIRSSSAEHATVMDVKDSTRLRRLISADFYTM